MASQGTINRRVTRTGGVTYVATTTTLSGASPYTTYRVVQGQNISPRRDSSGRIIPAGVPISEASYEFGRSGRASSGRRLTPAEKYFGVELPPELRNASIGYLERQKYEDIEELKREQFGSNIVTKQPTQQEIQEQRSIAGPEVKTFSQRTNNVGVTRLGGTTIAESTLRMSLPKNLRYKTPDYIRKKRAQEGIVEGTTINEQNKQLSILNNRNYNKPSIFFGNYYEKPINIIKSKSKNINNGNLITGRTTSGLQTSYNPYDELVNKKTNEFISQRGIEIRPTTSYQEFLYGRDVNLRGRYEGYTPNVIYVNPNLPYGEKETTKFHELGHFIDFNVLGTTSRMSFMGTPSATELTRERTDIKTDQDFNRELYAETFSEYLASPITFKTNYPNLARGFEGALGIEYQEVPKQKNIFTSNIFTGQTARDVGKINFISKYSGDLTVNQGTRTDLAPKFEGKINLNLPERIPSELKASDKVSYFQQKEFESYYSKSYTTRLGTSAITFGAGVYSGIKNIPKIPKATYQLVTKPKETALELGYQFKTRPFFTAGELSGPPILFKGLKGTLKTTKNIYVSAGKTYITPEKVIDIEVLKGKSQFPTQRSPIESLSEFEKAREPSGKIAVVHATPRTEFFPKETQIKGGPAGERALEDVGLYVTPKGRASPYFLKVSGEQETKISLKPDFSYLKTPSFIEVGVKNVKMLPKSLLKESGFQNVNKYLQEQAGTGEAFITKRSVYQTPELEAVIPKGTKLKRTVSGRGYESYTKYKGTNIPIKKYETVIEGELSKETFNIKDISKEQSRFYEYYGKPTTRTPYPYLSGAYSKRFSYKPYGYENLGTPYSYNLNYKDITYPTYYGKPTTRTSYLGSYYGGANYYPRQPYYNYEKTNLVIPEITQTSKVFEDIFKREEKKLKKKEEKRKKDKENFVYFPNFYGLLKSVEEGRYIKEPKGSKVFKGFEPRLLTSKPLSISPIKNVKANLFNAPRSIFKPLKKKKKQKTTYKTPFGKNVDYPKLF